MALDLSNIRVDDSHQRRNLRMRMYRTIETPSTLPTIPYLMFAIVKTLMVLPASIDEK